MSKMVKPVKRTKSKAAGPKAGGAVRRTAARPRAKPAAVKNKKPGAVVRRPPSARRKPVAKKKQIKRQAKKIIWRILAIFGLPLLVLSAVAYYFLFVYSVVPEPRPHVVPQGASVSRVAGDLGQGAAFKLVVMLNGNKVMAGTYDLPAGASVWRLARMLARGEVAGVSITIPEGLTVRQIVNLLNENRFLTGDAKHNYKDGDLFPDTYVVPKGTGRAATMDLMARKMEQIKNRYTDARASFLLPSPLKDWNEVMTLASIVQKETAKTREMPLVASVYLNRLRKKMRLQADPTVVYAITNGLGDMQERRLYEKHLRAASPYNTYRKVGLPPAPIANVGLDAIRAVLNPADTNYYYFVADGDGGHTFSRTLDEHNQKRSVWREIKFNNSKSGSQNPKSAIPEARRPAVAPRAR